MLRSLATCWIAFAIAGGAAQGRGETTVQVARSLVESGRVPSLSVAVIRGDEITEAATFGVADHATGQPATVETLYEAASLTKPVVALLALRLVDSGALALDEMVAQSVPAPRVRDRERWARVTPRHLLSHSAGFPNWSGDSLDFERTTPLTFDFEPGSQFAYSGEGYALLGALIERKAGRSLEELSDALFAELGMKRSFLLGVRASDPVARGHFGLSPARAARRLDRPIPAYSLLTTAADYARFVAFVAAGGDLSPSTLAESRRVHVEIASSFFRGPRAPGRLGWSLGWGVQLAPGAPVYFQWGDNGAFRAFAAYQPSAAGAARGIVFFANGSRGLLDTNALASPIVGDLSPAVGWFSSRPLEWLRVLVRR